MPRVMPAARAVICCGGGGEVLAGPAVRDKGFILARLGTCLAGQSQNFPGEIAQYLVSRPRVFACHLGGGHRLCCRAHVALEKPCLPASPFAQALGAGKPGRHRGLLSGSPRAEDHRPYQRYNPSRLICRPDISSPPRLPAPSTLFLGLLVRLPAPPGPTLAGHLTRPPTR